MNPSDPDIRVSIVDDDESFGDSLLLLINGTSGLACISRYSDGRSAMQGLIRDRPDVILMDLHMPEASGIECIKNLKPRLKDAQFVVLTSYSDDQRVFESLKSGASGYMLKRCAPLEILQAITEVHAGGSPMSSYIARRVVQSFSAGKDQKMPARASDLPKLSPRETEIVVLLSQGYLYKEIAGDLSISIETVRTHLRRTYEKLQVRTRTEAVVKYLGH